MPPQNCRCDRAISYRRVFKRATLTVPDRAIHYTVAATKPIKSTTFKWVMCTWPLRPAHPPAHAVHDAQRHQPNGAKHAPRSRSYPSKLAEEQWKKHGNLNQYFRLQVISIIMKIVAVALFCLGVHDRIGVQASSVGIAGCACLFVM